VNEKLKQMDKFDIRAAVVSVANPWIDFFEAEEQINWARLLNDDLNDICKTHPGRFFGFGMLPLKTVSQCVAELHRISKELTFLKGVILSTSGLVAGLDDEKLLPLFATAESLKLTIFIHPHYGIGNESFGGYGHTLYLALGFPFETTTAIARLILAGVLEKHPALRLLLAHSGGVLPYLAGRLDSCVRNDEQYDHRKYLSKPPSEYLKNLYFDAITYHAAALNCAIEFAGIDHLLFGTDHPFSISDPSCLYSSMKHLSEEEQRAIRTTNAQRLLSISF